MVLLKNPYVAVAVVITCAVIFYLSNTTGFFGKFINRFFPCTQNPATSFPCYMGFDVALMIIAGVTGLTFTVIFFFDLYKMFKG